MVEDTFETCRSIRPPAPQPSSGPLPPHKLLQAVLFNPLNLWRREHFEAPVVVESTMLGPRLVVSDPALIKWILVDNAANYVRDGLQQRVVLRMTGRGVLSAEGADWHLQRKTLAPFFSAKSLVAYLPSMTAAAEEAANRFRTSGEAGINLGREMAALTVDVLGRTVFPYGLGESPAAIADSVRQFADTNGPVELGDFFGFPSWMPGVRRLLGWRAIALVRQRARRIIAEAKVSDRSQKNDLLFALFSARDSEVGKTLGAREIEDNVSTLIGAGSETVAVALTWAIFLLSQVPYVREAVEAEISVHMKDGPLTADTLGNLAWTRAVVEESMRLYPPAPLIGRMTLSEERLGGERYPAGTAILISPWVLHRHARLWSKPDMFDPERFLPGRRDQISRYAYLPFGAGPRVCLGMGFAMQEAVVVLATLIKHLRFERADNHPIRLRQCITLQTDAPLQMKIRPR
jgi:cytochrome P450